MKFSEHITKQSGLLFCGKCPFLGEGTYDGDIECGSNRKNGCGVNAYYFGEANEFHRAKWGTLEDGINPKRTEGCLQLFKHFHSQLTKKPRPKYRNDNEIPGGEHDWARYDEDGSARSRA